MAQPPEFRQVQLVGRKIRQLRKERHQTQTELAQRLGIQQSDLSRMEKGEYRVSLDTLFKILAEFRIGVGEFFEEVARESFTPRDLRLLHAALTVTGRALPLGQTFDTPPSPEELYLHHCTLEMQRDSHRTEAAAKDHEAKLQALEALQKGNPGMFEMLTVPAEAQTEEAVKEEI